MATLVLQAAGAFLGGAFGPVGATIGAAVGSLAGYVVDRQIVASTQSVEGPRLSAVQPFTAEEGAPIPRVYGTARIGGTVIWATRFEEFRTTKRQGSKGGPKVSSYSYYANVAFALCEGEIAAIRRVWADGREIDLENVDMRIYNGDETQLPDPLIEAKQGAGNAPAYRGTAYVVFERLPIDDYGNRIPQFQFEVIRVVGDFNARIRSVCLIPGSTEYGLSPSPVSRIITRGAAESENRHVLFGRSDYSASIDELQALCPNLEYVALVVTWFGNDLRAGQCRVRPAVTENARSGLSETWSVAGASRISALQVSKHGGSAAFGGTPSDQSVRDAIADLKARGLKVVFYPFVMMDIPEGNGLPDPYGAIEQQAYPWRGRISCHPAPGQPDTVDKTHGARTQIGNFAGMVTPADYAGFTYNGNPDEWSYSRLVMHYAKLCEQAGGVDTFLIGSELRGLTTIRDETGAFPFVEDLVAIAGNVKTILGVQTSVTYGADWSEYFGYQPDDGSGDVFFHLDALWGSPSIDAVGIDYYMPLADWRDDDYSGGNPDGYEGPCDIPSLRKAINSGEGFDWYYASPPDRENRSRTAITDGAYGKPWVFRYKDIAAWWSNQHFERIGGVENPLPTAWVPEKKPIWFMEAGCPAADKGANQPNVFTDPKSSESAFPYFSSGGRDDFAQRSYLEALLSGWDSGDPDFLDAANPQASLYQGRMVDPSRISIWAWDLRPFPAFPLMQSHWGDGENWYAGHWLNGRLSGVAVGDLISAVAEDNALAPVDVSGVAGLLSGYVIAVPGSARSVLESLLEIFRVRDSQSGDIISFRTRPAASSSPFAVEDLVAVDEEPLATLDRRPIDDLPARLDISYYDPMREYQSAFSRTVPVDDEHGRDNNLSLPAILEQGAAEVLCAQYRRERRVARTSLTFGVAHGPQGLTPGDIVNLAVRPGENYEIEEIEDGAYRKVTARRMEFLPPIPDFRGLPGTEPATPSTQTLPFAVFLDLPLWDSGTAPEDQLRVAVWADPWQSHSISASPDTSGFSLRNLAQQPITLGYLEDQLVSGVSARIDRASRINVFSPNGEYSSVSRQLLLGGANLAAVQATTGAWEVIQFEKAEDKGGGSWQLSNLLRGLAGTEDAAQAGSIAGSPFILLDDAVVPAGLHGTEIGLELNWRIESSRSAISGLNFLDLTATGGLRALTPYSPVHLKAKELPDGSIWFSWIRRGRIDADSWLAAEIPVGEDAEAYQLKLFSGGTVLREADLFENSWIYPASDRLSDFDAGSANFDLTIRQVSARVGPGLPTTRSFSF
jgi:hypothetical protein